MKENGGWIILVGLIYSLNAHAHYNYSKELNRNI